MSVCYISEHNLSVILNITGCGTVNFLLSVPFTLILTLPKAQYTTFLRTNKSQSSTLIEVSSEFVKFY